MQVYFSAYGIKGIRKVLKQFDEKELSEYQRDILHHRLQMVEFRRTNGRNIALTALLKNEKPPKDQKPSMGCSIKWK